MSTSSKKVLCSPGRHIVSADSVTMYHVTVRITDLKLTAASSICAREWDKRVKQ